MESPVLTFTEYLLANSEALGILGIGVFGGTIGHALAYEEADFKWARCEHVRKLFIGWLYSLFIATLGILCRIEYGGSFPVYAGGVALLSVFGADTIRALSKIVMRRVFNKPLRDFKNGP